MQRGSPHFARSGSSGGLHTHGAWEYQCDPQGQVAKNTWGLGAPISTMIMMS